MEEHKEETRPRGMRVHATWTPEPRSRTGPPSRLRETRSHRRRTSSPTCYREAARIESSTFLRKTQRKARDELLDEAKR